jgi:hypothetical protein
MNKVDRYKYYASREWALVKERVKERSRGLCERCYNGAHDHTHHLTYERFGNELLADLIGVCEPCHEFLSGKRSEDPANQFTARDAELIINIFDRVTKNGMKKAEDGNKQDSVLVIHELRMDFKRAIVAEIGR